jgi:hypothetical protein
MTDTSKALLAEIDSTLAHPDSERYHERLAYWLARSRDRIAELERELAEARKEGEIEATRRWAHWKDGVQYVGTCGTTLAKALADIDAALAAKGEK